RGKREKRCSRGKRGATRSKRDRDYLGASEAACHTQGIEARATPFQARNEKRISPGEYGRSRHNSITSNMNQTALAARNAASHGSRAHFHISTASTARNATNSHFAGRAPSTPARDRRPARRSGSKSMTSPNKWECIANMAPNRNVNHGTWETWFSQLARTNTSR